ncbi:MAG: citrate/2-methylcitrate synthase [Acidimicrobiales bacterium]
MQDSQADSPPQAAAAAIGSDPIEETGLTTAEVAQLLGVKRQTIYAYVSRGILHRQMAMDGRTSRFDRSEVEALRLGRRPDTDGEMRTMLATRLTRVSDDGLLIRGQDLVDLIDAGAGFTEVADLLWDSPADEQWPTPDAVSSREKTRQAAPTQLTLLDQLRVIVAHESSADPLRHDLSSKSVRAAGRRAIVAMSNGIGGGPIDQPSEVQSLGGLLLARLSSTSWRPAQRRSIDVALALMADHGLASSTFAARIAASVRADPYSVIAAGLGVLGGPLHGAASGAVHGLYLAAEAQGDAAAAVGEAQRRGSLPGFGHAVYQAQDPRYGALMSQIIEAWSDDPRLQTVFRVRDVVGERSGAMPNVDLAIGALSYLAGLPADAGEAIFAIARTAGWLAHAMEEYEEKALRFRPKARYIGNRPKAR